MENKKKTAAAAGGFFAFVFLATILSCAGLPPEGKRYDHIQLDGYTVINNAWGKYVFGYQYKTDHKQAIFQKKNAQGETVYGWNWEWPPYNGEVKGYPAVLFGWKPSYSTSTTPALPVKLKDLKSLTATFDCAVKGTGKYNLAFDLWITRTREQKHPQTTREIMVWVDNSNWDTMDEWIQSAGTVTIDGQEYKFNTGAWKWSYLAFVKIKREQKGTIALDRFVEYLIDNKFVSEDEYLASIEFGNEVIDGSGEAIVRSFSVEVNQ